ncbi:hypothetical protein BKA81DRAFT_373412 [Phyllosticta paracitricarpa]
MSTTVSTSTLDVLLPSCRVDRLCSTWAGEVAKGEALEDRDGDPQSDIAVIDLLATNEPLADLGGESEPERGIGAHAVVLVMRVADLPVHFGLPVDATAGVGVHVLERHVVLLDGFPHVFANDFVDHALGVVGAAVGVDEDVLGEDAVWLLRGDLVDDDQLQDEREADDHVDVDRASGSVFLPFLLLAHVTLWRWRLACLEDLA